MERKREEENEEEGRANQKLGKIEKEGKEKQEVGRQERRGDGRRQREGGRD